MQLGADLLLAQHFSRFDPKSLSSYFPSSPPRYKQCSVYTILQRSSFETVRGRWRVRHERGTAGAPGARRAARRPRRQGGGTAKGLLPLSRGRVLCRPCMREIIYRNTKHALLLLS